MIPNCKNKTNANKNIYLITEQMMSISEDVLADYPNEVAYLQKLVDDILNASDYNEYPIVYVVAPTPDGSSPISATVSKYVRRLRTINIICTAPSSTSISSIFSAKTQIVDICGLTVKINLDANDKVKSSLQEDIDRPIGALKFPFLTTSEISEGDIETFTPTHNYHPATKKYVDDSILNNDNMQNLEIEASNLANWGCSSYDYGTPTPEELTTYLTENNNLILNKITKWVEKGTILKVSYIQSTADRASRYSRYFTVSYNYGYGDMYGDKYKFKDLDGSSEFYISIPAGSQTQYMWNTWINADNPIGCLTENIQVLVDTNTETGDVFTKVKNLKVGDTVLSYNIENDKIEHKKITDIIIKEGNIINTISTQTQTFSVTNNHQIYTNDLKLVNAGTIKSQDLLTNINREDVKVGNNIAKYIEDGETVYEIIVEDNNNLFITKEKILIHNGS